MKRGKLVEPSKACRLEPPTGNVVARFQENRDFRKLDFCFKQFELGRQKLNFRADRFDLLQQAEFVFFAMSFFTAIYSYIRNVRSFTMTYVNKSESTISST